MPALLRGVALVFVRPSGIEVSTQVACLVLVTVNGGGFHFQLKAARSPLSLLQCLRT